tara:strand:- start:3 stop:536 length:534 start_codon:yes stop_codon:yes gene_type:complete
VTLIKKILKKHVEDKGNNYFIYVHKIAWYLLSDKEKKLYEDGFINGYKQAQQNKKKGIKVIEQVPSKYKWSDRQIVYQFSKPKQQVLNCLINKVCKKYEINQKELLGKARTRDVVRSRNICQNILHDKYKMSLSSIGKIFGQDHTTVTYAIQMKLQKKYYWDSNQTIWNEYEELIKS